MTRQLVISRPLGPGENFFRCRTEVDFYRNFGSIATFSRCITDDLPLLYRALRKSVLDYHILVCNVFQDTALNATVMRPVARVALGDVVLVSGPYPHPGQPALEKFLHRLCRDKLSELYTETPLFKVIVSGKDVGVAFEHTLADGVVAMYFHEILLENLGYCSDPANAAAYEREYGPCPETVTFDTVFFEAEADEGYIKNSLPPPLEVAMQDPSVDYTDNNPAHYSKVVPAEYPEKWGGRFPVSRDFSVAFKTINVPPAQFLQILKQCKENKVTFTSYLSHVQALAFQPIYGAAHHTLSMVAMTLRRFLLRDKCDERYDSLFSLGYRLLGMYAHMGVPEYFPPTTEFSWDTVRLLNGRMVQSLQNDKLLNMRKAWYDLPQTLDANEEFFLREVGRNKADTIKISNVGLAKLPPTGGWAVENLVFAQDMAPNASEFVLNVVSSAQAGLNIVVTYFDHQFEAGYENFDEFPARLRRLLMECAGVTEA